MKRIFTLCLVSVMLLCCATVACADDVIVKTDNFDDLPLGEITQGDLRSVATVLDSSSMWYDGASVEVTANGYSGNCIEITEDGGSKFQFYSQKVNGTESAPVYLCFKLSVIENFDNTATFKIDLGYNGMVYIQQGSIMVRTPDGPNTYDRLPLVEGEWYDFLYTFTSNRADVTISDGEGNTVSGYTTGYNFLNIASNSITAGSKIAIDEMNMFMLTEDANAAVLDSSIPEEILNMSRIPGFDLKFNQPIATENITVSVMDAMGNPVESTLYTVTPNGYLGIKVDFIGMLEKGTDYTMVLSGVETMAGTSADNIEIAFTTEFVHMLTLANKSVHQEGAKTHVELTFEGTMGYVLTPVRVMGVLYEDEKMTSLEYKETAIDADGKLSLEFTLNERSGKEIFSILVFDDSDTLIPVSEAIACLE